MFGLSISSHFCCSGDVDAEPSMNRFRQTSNQNVSVMMMFMMRVVMTIRTGRCTPHSAAWFGRRGRNKSGAKPPGARGWRRASVPSLEVASAGRDWSETDERHLVSPFVKFSSSLFLHCITLLGEFALVRASFQLHWLDTPLPLHNDRLKHE